MIWDSFQDAVTYLFHKHHGVDVVTNYIASVSVVSFMWLPVLQNISLVAAQLLPILGCTWLVVQLVCRIIDRIKEKKEKPNE